MKLLTTPRFDKEYGRLPASIRARADKQFALFEQNPRHPSLQTEKLQGFNDIWKGRITQQYRFIFQIEGDTCTLRRIGSHDIERHP